MEQEHFADELENTNDKISNQADLIESLEYELAAAVEDSVVGNSNLCSAVCVQVYHLSVFAILHQNKRVHPLLHRSIVRHGIGALHYLL